MNKPKHLYGFLPEVTEETRQECLEMALKWKEPTETVVEKFSEGKYGNIYSLTRPKNHHPRFRVAKFPHFREFNSLKDLKETFEVAFHELEICQKLLINPWAQKFDDLLILFNWPFFFSNLRDGTLLDLISNPLSWNYSDKLQVCILILRGLILSRAKGILSHQDLKPANIFFDNLDKNTDYPGKSLIKFWIKIGDFGMANAFTDFSKNFGSRPYQAPEQYEKKLIEVQDAIKIDIFALGVIFHEIFADGLHPLGQITNDVWPIPLDGKSKWKRENIWKNWARNEEKEIKIKDPIVSSTIKVQILKMLSVDKNQRPDLEDILEVFLDMFKEFDPEREASVRWQIDNLEEQWSVNKEWPHLNDLIRKAISFYSKLK